MFQGEKERRHSHSLVGDDAIGATGLELAHNLARPIHFDTPQDILGPGDAAVVGRVPHIAQVDMTAHTAAAGTTLGTCAPSTAAASTTSTPESGRAAFATLLGEENTPGP